MNLTVFATANSVFVNTECVLGFSYARVASTGEVYTFLRDHASASHHQRMP